MLYLFYLCDLFAKVPQVSHPLQNQQALKEEVLERICFPETRRPGICCVMPSEFCEENKLQPKYVPRGSSEVEKFWWWPFSSLRRDCILLSCVQYAMFSVLFGPSIVFCYEEFGHFLLNIDHLRAHVISQRWISCCYIVFVIIYIAMSSSWNMLLIQDNSRSFCMLCYTFYCQ